MVSLAVDFAEIRVKTDLQKMFKKKKEVGAITSLEDHKNQPKRVRKKRPRDKCDNFKRCWGFCDFLKTSWKLFKEFSADTSIHGRSKSRKRKFIHVD
jgi:hypothetical protein